MNKYLSCLIFIIFHLLSFSNLISSIEHTNGGWKPLGEEPIAIDGPCNIERRDINGLSQEEFMEKYKHDTPFIVYNVDNEKFRSTCERKNIIKNWGDKPVTLNSANTYSYTRMETTFNDYVKMLMIPQDEKILGNETYILFGPLEPTIWDGLYTDYNLPKYKIPDATISLSFGVAGKGTGVPFHFHGITIAESIHGRKRWFLQPYNKRPKFDPNQSTLHWYLNEYPKLSEADKPLECIVGPGEMIYLPDRFWHATLNTETAVFISSFFSIQVNKRNADVRSEL